MIIMNGQLMPFKDSVSNKMELINEMGIVIVMYHMICFTDFNPSKEAAVQMGWSCCYCTGFVMTLNFGNLCW